MITLRIAFCHTIDNDQYPFQTKKQAEVIAKGLTSNQVRVTEYEKTEDYAYILFNEYVNIQVSEQDIKRYNLDILADKAEPRIPGGEFKFARTIK